ncbi:MAG: zinc-binding dehydrogenase, partial [Anaerolineae bacterium]
AGAIPVIAADPNPQRRELARSLGADIVLDPLAADYARTVKEATGGQGINAAVEVTGAAEALTQTLGCMARFGRVALLGCTRTTQVTLDFYHLVHFPGVALIGANNDARPRLESAPGNWTARDDCQALLKLMAGGRLNLAPLISEIHSPLEAPEVYRRLAFEYGSFPIGVLFDWSRL